MSTEQTPATTEPTETEAKVSKKKTEAANSELEMLKAQVAALEGRLAAQPAAPVAPTSEQLSAEAQAQTDRMRTKALLDAQPKRMVRLRQAPKGQPALPDAFVGVNGYNYQFHRGVDIEVPTTVYELLWEAGEI